MPKLKTHSGTKDRVKISKNGKVRAGSPNRNHFMSKKSGARKRRLAGLQTLVGANKKTLKLKLGA
ncbi:MAG TPA: bL35 family ribosomal protein [Candidatus Saccharimonadales bacterium]|nr:bL35 family ribosomal protein [Candidatus Saccharimonadales bacterium]